MFISLGRIMYIEYLIHFYLMALGGANGRGHHGFRSWPVKSLPGPVLTHHESVNEE